jgi:hypothetical protein
MLLGNIIYNGWWKCHLYSIDIAVNTKKTKYMGVEPHRGTMLANEHIMIGSISYGKVKTFKYLGSLSKNKNSIQEDIKCRLKAGYSCCYSVQTFISSQHLANNIKIKIHIKE